MSAKKIDYKKQFPDLYNPSKEPHIVEIPEMLFFTLKGSGYPGDNPEYQEALGTLYGASFTLKMKIVKPEMSRDYVVPPSEGLWYMDDMSRWSMDNKDEWKWTMMIRIPDFVTEEQIKRAMQIFKETKNPSNIEKLNYEKYNEGTVVQVLYMGPYSDEGPTIAKMHEYAEEQGYVLDGHHHEIYLSDPRRTKPEKLRTVIRQPVRKT
ncbi:MAG: GyrI-like domain-containing protein [Candidatus Hodarchaeales archaeon]|jgi:hypothetical protein